MNQVTAPKSYIALTLLYKSCRSEYFTCKLGLLYTMENGKLIHGMWQKITLFLDNIPLALIFMILILIYLILINVFINMAFRIREVWYIWWIQCCLWYVREWHDWKTTFSRPPALSDFTVCNGVGVKQWNIQVIN